jgi:membrane protein
LAWIRKIPATTWKLFTQTIGVCMRYRVTGLAAEGAFFAILSLPPLIFGLAGSLGYIASKWFEVETIQDIKTQIVDLAARALTDESIKNVITPTLDSVLNGGRPDVISIGFVLALWSGSRALNVFVDTITIMYGMGGKRGIVRTRVLSFSLYCAALVIGVIVLPLVLAGPDAINTLLPSRLDFLNQLYWPVVTILSAGFLNTLYHLSVPVRTPWVSDLPGSFLALSIWILGSFVLRWILQSTVGGTSIYGPLAAPIAVLMWLYMTAIAVLIGAALNAVVDRLWPHKQQITEMKPKEASEDKDDEVEPVMKAEPEPHHEHPLTPVEERPETKVARRIEKLGEHGPAVGSERFKAGSSEREAGSFAPKQPEAADPKVATEAETERSAGNSDGARPAGVPSPRGPRPAGRRVSQDGEGEPDPERRPASVGKPGAQGDTDDLG